LCADGPGCCGGSVIDVQANVTEIAAETSLHQGTHDRLKRYARQVQHLSNRCLEVTCSIVVMCHKWSVPSSVDKFKNVISNALLGFDFRKIAIITVVYCHVGAGGD